MPDLPPWSVSAVLASRSGRSSGWPCRLAATRRLPLSAPQLDSLNTPLTRVEIIDVSVHAREEHFLVPVALTVAAHLRCVQLASTPAGHTNFLRLSLLFNALRAAIWPLRLDMQPGVFPFSFRFPGEPAAIPLRCVCETAGENAREATLEDVRDDGVRP